MKPQLGVAGFFIDIAVRNPDRREEFLTGIECDGATYHSGFSVRDRDRIRQEILESLGWKGRIWRIWSADWFYNPRQETEKLLAFLEGRRQLSKQEKDPDYDKEESLQEAAQEEPAPEAHLEEELCEAIASSAAEDLFVEVGDRVIYCLADKPEEKHVVVISAKRSVPGSGIINEKTHVAQALLGLSPREENDLEIPYQRKRVIRVLKIQRQQEMF